MWPVEQRIVYLSRLTRLPLLGADGADIGRIVDAVVDLGSKPPRVNGVVVGVQRRRVFVGIGRIGEIESEGARLRRGSVNMRHFELRPGERLLAGELLGKRLKGDRVSDIGLSPAPDVPALTAAVQSAGYSDVRVTGRGPRHLEVAAKDGDGREHELHVGFDGQVRERPQP